MSVQTSCIDGHRLTPPRESAAAARGRCGVERRGRPMSCARICFSFAHVAS